MSDTAPRKLSLFDTTLFVMGGIIGVGIFFTPSQAAAAAFEPWAFLTIWVVGGLIAMCAAFTFAELGASLPRTGGWFVYLREGFGPFPAFLFAWIVLFIVSTGAIATMATFCANMLHVALPAVVGGDGSLSHGVAATALILFVTAIALSGVKRAALAQNACMVVKLLAILALTLGGLVFFTPGAAGEAAVTPAAPAEGGSLLRGMLAALLPVFYSYGGWQMVGYLAPQVEHPERNLPRAIVMGVGGVIVVYLAVNLSYLAVLGIDGVAASPDFAAAVARVTFGPTGERVLAAGMAVSALGVCAVTIIATPWLYVAMASEGLFFESVARLHPRTAVPARALALQAVLALIYLYAGTLQYLVGAVVFVEWIFHGAVAAALIYMRRSRPTLARPYASPLYPLAPGVYFLAACVVVISTFWTSSWTLWSTGSVIVVVGSIVYRPWRRLVAAR